MTTSPARFDAPWSDSSRPDPWRPTRRETSPQPRSTPVPSSDSDGSADTGAWTEAYLQGLIARVAQACNGYRPTPLAAKLDLHPETVRRYLNGQRPSPEFLAALCRELGVSPQWLILGEGDMYRPR